MYIQRFCSISPAGVITPGTELSALERVQGAAAPCAEPDYKDLIPPMQLRRMTKPVRTGVAASRLCLQDTGVAMPASIHVGTAYGMLQDSENFLEKMIVQEEQMLNPTAFIQSTHNTVAGQIALSMGCMAHNMTFVHKAHSFESALMDAALMQDTGIPLLAGAVDETTDTSYAILERFGIYHEGNTAGEGASFFLLSHQRDHSSLAQILAYDMFTAIGNTEAKEKITAFCTQHGLQMSATDLVLNGMEASDIPDALRANPVTDFKSYCGEFPTATAFALAMGTLALTQQQTDRCWIFSNLGKYYSAYCVVRAEN